METWVAATFSICTIIGVWLLVWGWRVVNSIWVRPKKLEKYLRDQGLAGNSYRLLVGDRKDISARMAQAMSKPMNFSHRIFPRVLPFVHQTIQIYGKNSFMWDGLIPSVLIVEPEQVKTALLSDDIRKPKIKPLVKLLADGLVNHEGPKWVKHRKIINPAFHLEKLKDMVPAFSQCCNKMVNKWEKMVSKEGQCELNVMPYLQTVAADMISRTAFGSSYEKGKMIFELQKQLSALVVKSMMITNPILRFFPTKSNDKMVKINKEMKILISSIINERKKDMEAGEAACNDLLGILIESNLNEIRQKHGNNKDAGMSIEDVIEECKLFYLAGQETTATLLVWTMILLSSYSDWQERARAEVLQVFGNREPDFDGLSRLKIVTMILNEVLRLYPPVSMLERVVQKETRLGQITLPAGVMVRLPIVFIQQDPELWGEDAHEFKPERFSEGVSKATKNQTIFIPFGGGPRICIGLNFAMIEAKTTLSIILRRFSFQLSPSYIHAPFSSVSTQPQHGAHIILHKLD